MNSQRSSLARALNPENIAVIGASDRAQSRGSYVWRAVAHSPLIKNAWAINPKYKYIGERPCFAKVSEVPGNIDLAVISLRADRILKALIDVGERGAACVLITPDENAFSCDRLWLEKLQIVTKQYSLRMIGPDSLGIMNPGSGVNVSYWPTLPLPGNVALIAQSGMIATALIDYAQEAELGFSGVINTGAGIDVDLPELLDYYTADKNTRVIALHIEGIRHPRIFYSALRAAAARKHVVILKAGSGAGFAADRIASFKLGTDAGRDDAFSAMIRRAGALLVSTFEEFTAAVAALATNRLPRGKRLAVIANGSGFAALTADAAQSRNIDLHGLSNTTIGALQEAFPSQQVAVNPINVGATASADRYRRTLQLVLQDSMIDGAIVVVAPGPVSTIDPTLRFLAKTAAGSYKPVITAWVSDRITRSVRKQLRSVPNAPISAIQSPVSAAHAFGYLAEQAQNRAGLREPPAAWRHDIAPEAIAKARALLSKIRQEGRHSLRRAETVRLLECFDIPSVPIRDVRTLDEARQAAASLGYPVALKVEARGLGHKSDVGGVELDIANEDALRVAWTNIENNVARLSPMTPMEGAVVQPMVPHAALRELRLAVVHDNVLGPFIEFGAGGIASDLYHDKRAALPPLALREAQALVNAPAVAKTFGRFRGLSPVEGLTLARIVCRLSTLVCLIPAIRALTINPLVWTGNDASVLDAVAHLSEEPVAPDRTSSHLTVAPPPIEDRTLIPQADAALLTLRPMESGDFSALRDFISRLSDKTRYLRFHTGQAISDDRVVELCTIDYARESVWVVEGQNAIHAAARWRLTDTQGEAEFGIVVEDVWQRRGLARRLMAKLESEALNAGVTHLVGYVLKGNEAMQGMMLAMGFQKTGSDSRDTDPWIKPIGQAADL